MQTLSKITPADYPELLASVAAGMTQRELARQYGCAPSLVARHLARARRAEEQRDPTERPDAGATDEPLDDCRQIEPGPAPGAAMSDGPTNTGVDIRQRLEQEALHSTDARSRLAALRELRLLNESGGAGETPSRPEGFTFPWPADASSAAIFYFNVEDGLPADLPLERSFIVHRGQMGNPDKPSLIVYPLPPDAFRDPTPEEEAEIQARIDALNARERAQETSERQEVDAR